LAFASAAIAGPPPKVYASLSISGSADFGTVTIGQGVTQTFTVTNQGRNPATGISGDTFSDPNFSFAGGSYPGLGGTCDVKLTNRKSCTIVVTFAPSQDGTLSGTLALSYSDPQSVQREFLLALTGAAMEPISINLTDPASPGSMYIADGTNGFAGEYYLSVGAGQTLQAAGSGGGGVTFTYYAEIVDCLGYTNGPSTSPFAAVCDYTLDGQTGVLTVPGPLTLLPGHSGGIFNMVVGTYAYDANGNYLGFAPAILQVQP
jgi:uncharacterized repeat protein (TIGR01451 family)